MTPHHIILYPLVEEKNECKTVDIHLRGPMKSSTRSDHAVHSSERSDASEIIVRQLVGMGKGESDLRRESPVRASR
jgi:hypothetical protein